MSTRTSTHIPAVVNGEDSSTSNSELLQPQRGFRERGQLDSTKVERSTLKRPRRWLQRLRPFALSSFDKIFVAVVVVNLQRNPLLRAVNQLGDANEVLNERAVVVMARMSNKLTGRDFSSCSSLP